MKEFLEMIVSNLSIFESIQDNGTALLVNKKAISLKKYSEIQVIGLGKASANLTANVIDKIKKMTLPNTRLKQGIVITKYRHSIKHPNFDCFEAGHPSLDDNSFIAGAKLQEVLAKVSPDGIIILCLSGGASSLVEIPFENFIRKDIEEINEVLLKSGASIIEMNKIRKEMSSFKNGGMLTMTPASTILTLAVSDIPEDDFASIGSGPTKFNDSSIKVLKEIAKKYLPTSLLNIFTDHLKSTSRKEFIQIKKAHIEDKTVINKVVNDFYKMRNDVLNELKYQHKKNAFFFEFPHNSMLEAGITDHLDKISEMAIQHASEPFYIFSGGELTINVLGDGVGGRNTHFVLEMVNRLFYKNVLNLPQNLLQRCIISSIGTDGTDGPTDAAGAYFDYQKFLRAKEQGLDIEHYLGSFDSYNFFGPIDALLITGPTGTNVMDLRLIAFE